MLELIIDAYKEKTKDKNFFETVKNWILSQRFFWGFLYWIL